MGGGVGVGVNLPLSAWGFPGGGRRGRRGALAKGVLRLFLSLVPFAFPLPFLCAPLFAFVFSPSSFHFTYLFISLSFFYQAHIPPSSSFFFVFFVLVFVVVFFFQLPSPSPYISYLPSPIFSPPSIPLSVAPLPSPPPPLSSSNSSGVHIHNIPWLYFPIRPSGAAESDVVFSFRIKIPSQLPEGEGGGV